MNDQANILISKLDEFIRKFYKNQLIKGLILAVGGIALTFAIISLLEYFGHFNTTVRTVLFFSFLFFSLFVLIKFILVPLSKLYKMGKTLNYEEAANIIGKHFPEVSDKLLNTIQLQSAAEGVADNSLLLASIDHRISELKPIPFSNAIDLKENLRYLRYSAIPVLLVIIVFAVSPGFKDSSQRIVNYNTYYEKEAPFAFEITNRDLTAIQNEDLEVGVVTRGEVLPSEAFIVIDGNRFKMKKGQDQGFTYTLKNLTQKTKIHFESGEVNSREYDIDVLVRPLLLDFETVLDYPKYTGLKDEKLRNTTDLTIPAGTKVAWKFKTRNTDDLKLYVGGEAVKAERSDEGFSYAKSFLNTGVLSVSPSNREVGETDSAKFLINVVPDNYPTIEFEEREDSLSSKVIYMMGQITDDYGFRTLQFKYRFTESADKKKVSPQFETVTLRVEPGLTKQRFYHMWDMNQIDLDPSDKIEYFFEVWDNDGVNGSKSARTTSKIYSAPSLDEINEETEKKAEKIKEDIKEAKDDMDNMEKSIQELEQRLTEKKELTWEDKQKIKQMLKQHEALQNKVESVVDQNKEKNNKESEFKKVDQEILEKQKQIEELFEKVVDDEMKKLMDQIQELMEQNRKEELQEKLEDMQLSDKDLEKQLDRMLEQLKQLQLEKKVNETIDKLNELAKEQEELSEDTRQDEKSNDELKEEQEKLQDKLKDAQKDLEQIQKQNQELESPLDMKTPKEEAEEAEKEQEKSQENLDKQDNQSSSENQKNAAQKMREAAKKMQQSMQSAQQKRQVENYNTLRTILENLVQVSKDQEDLMEQFGKISEYSPKYVELGQRQKKIRDDTKIIEDSLFALSKRVTQVEHFINKEIGLVNSNIDKALVNLGDRRTGNVINHQQYVMTSLNNLALMLSETLNQMQAQMKSNSSGGGQCNNPGGSNPKPGMKSLREMQQNLNDQLKQLQDAMGSDGKSKGQGKAGSAEFAKAAAQQAAIRQKLKEIQSQLDKEGKGRTLGDLKRTQEMMDDVEEDLYNKRLNPDVLKKQQEILIRMLEHEKAEKKQEQDDKRESNEGQDMKREVPPSIEEYLKQQEQEQELLKTLPPGLTPYYKNKVREYFRNLESTN